MRVTETYLPSILPCLRCTHTIFMVNVSVGNYSAYSLLFVRISLCEAGFIYGIVFPLSGDVHIPYRSVSCVCSTETGTKSKTAF